MKKLFLALIAAVTFFNLSNAQNDTMYVMKAGAVVSKRAVADIDSIVFYKNVNFSCGSPITINHVAGAVAPVTKTVTYGTVTGIPGEPSKCWITSNLGADHQATAVDDASEASAGWYWQYNRKQGYQHTGSARTPNTAWITSINENIEWLIANDPCALELGNGWRLPVYTEWLSVDASGGWTNWNDPWNSALKLHAAGYLNTTGWLEYRGQIGYYLNSTQVDNSNGWILGFSSINCQLYNGDKANGWATRCIKE